MQTYDRRLRLDLGFFEGTSECRANVTSKKNITMGRKMKRKKNKKLCGI